MKKHLTLFLIASFIACAAFAGPYINATPQVLGSFSYIAGGGPSASRAVVMMSAIMPLSSGTVTATSPADFEISLNNSSFSSSVTFPYSGDTLAPTNLYIRLKSGRVVGSYLNETISVASPGVSTTITVNGLVTNTCTIIPGLITSSAASFTWNPTGAASYEVIVDQIPGLPTAAGSPTANTAWSENTLSANTNYYIHVRGASGTGNYTDWTTQAFKTKSNTGVSLLPCDKQALVLLPNPNRGIFHVSGTFSGAADGPLELRVIDVTGQLIFRRSITLLNGAYSQDIQLSAPAGNYIISVGGSGWYGTASFSLVH